MQETEGKMMQCPYDPKHMIAAEHYYRHINKCDKRPELSIFFNKPYYKPRCADLQKRKPDLRNDDTLPDQVQEL